MRLLVGLPVYRRAWILPSWFNCLRSQTVPFSDIGFIFECAPNDESTVDAIWKGVEGAAYCSVVIRDDLEHEDHLDGGLVRIWNEGRYATMVELRNSLLERACLLAPELYLSLDSDVLLCRSDTLERLTEAKKDVVAPLCYMTPTGNTHPNFMVWDGTEIGGLPHATRQRSFVAEPGLHKTDVVMAAVMMSPDTYQHARYRNHPQGEDLGFATHLAELQISSYINTALECKHLMNRFHLQESS